MRHVKFILSALAILLAGAIAANMAARAVAAPRAGAVVSAGVVRIPSVLGQSAEEALFYPWSLYDMQTLVPLPEQVQSSIAFDIGHSYQDAMMASVAAMDAVGAKFDLALLLGSMTWNQGETKTADMVFLKDFPAALEDGSPVLLSYALSFSGPQSISWLMTPREAAEPTEEQRQAALDKVTDDLAGLLWNLLRPSRDFTNDMAAFLQDFDKQFTALNQNALHERLEFVMVQMLDSIGYSYFQEIPVTEAAGDEAVLSFDELAPSEPPPPAELLDRASGGGRLQIVSTQDQIVVLFTNDIGITLGVYYDIQLERYSGLGVSE